jgi:hypothetical protein
MSRRYIGTVGTGGGGGPITLAGDVTGPSGANVIDNLQGNPVVASSPVAGDVLTFDGLDWVPLPVSAISSTDAVLPFKLNGDVVTFPLTEPLDCQPCVMQACVATGVRFGHRVDSSGTGASGTTAGTLYKRTTPAARVAFATFSIAQGVGNNHSANGVFVGTLADRTFAATDQIEMELSSVMVSGATTQEQDLFVTVLLSP